MPPAASLKDRNVVVYGLAKSGLSALRLGAKKGARLTALDKTPRERLGDAARRALEETSATLRAEADADAVLGAADLVVVSPGVPLALPSLQAAMASGVQVVGEVEWAYRHLAPAPFFGITGTNGKSTTTALLGALFEAAGKRAFVGGNLGRPLSEAALSDEAWEAYVVELSSFQLEGLRTVRCHGAVILNLTPDHLDRYASAADYGAAKARIFLNQTPEDLAVVNADDPAVVPLAKGTAARVAGFSRRAAAGGAFTVDGQPYRLQNRALRGAHNLENAMAAVLLARHAGLTPEAIQRGLDAYGGLPHRLESVATVDGVEWVNDSKATNVDSTLVALTAFPKGNLWLVLGGKGKGAPYTPLVEAARGRVKGVLTLGDDAKRIEAAFENVLPTHACSTLEAAVAKARALAERGDVVLLSPACASYDQFKNFEHRGDVFKALVRGEQ